MTPPIRLFVGTDSRMGVAERALERSVRRNTSAPVEIVWMRSGDPGWTWDMGREPGHPYPKDGKGWATDFTCFRYAVPELCGFEGRAIYLDADMIVLGDLDDLVRLPIGPEFWAISTTRPDVIVFDCAKFSSVGWPDLGTMRTSGHGFGHYHGIFAPKLGKVVPDSWDCLDGRGLSAETKLVHYTAMQSQPWKPWPERFDYDANPHRSVAAVDLFWSYAGEAEE